MGAFAIKFDDTPLAKSQPDPLQGRCSAERARSGQACGQDLGQHNGPEIKELVSPAVAEGKTATVSGDTRTGNDCVSSGGTAHHSELEMNSPTGASESRSRRSDDPISATVPREDSMTLSPQALLVATSASLETSLTQNIDYISNDSSVRQYVPDGGMLLRSQTSGPPAHKEGAVQDNETQCTRNATKIPPSSSAMPQDEIRALLDSLRSSPKLGGASDALREVAGAAPLGDIEWALDKRNSLLVDEVLGGTHLEYFDTVWEKWEYITGHAMWYLNLTTLRGNIWILDACQLLYARKIGIIDKLPVITRDQVDDRNKGDLVVKGVVIAQVTWFIVQLVVRAASNLPSSQLEIVTLAMSACNFVTYILLLDKPQDIRTVSGASALSEAKPPNGDPRSADEQRELERARRAASETSREPVVSPWDHGDARKPLRQRVQRRSSKPDVPRPPPLPEWFLRENVRLFDDGAVGAKEDQAATRMLECVDIETGAKLFSVPGYPADGEVGKEGAREVSEEEDKEWASRAVPGIGLFSQNIRSPDEKATKKDPKSLGFSFGPPPAALHDGMNFDPLVWSLLETEAAARAAFSLAGDAGAASSHAASRTDIHLHCPDMNAHAEMDQHVQSLTRLLRADLLRLDANDLADLTADYVGENKDSPGSFSALAYDAFDGAVASGMKIREGSHSTGFESLAREEQEDDEDEADESSEPSPGSGGPERFDKLHRALSDSQSRIRKLLGGMGVAGVSIMPVPVNGMGGNPFAPQRLPQQRKKSESSSTSEFVTWDDGRLAASLDSILDAPSVRRAASSTRREESTSGDSLSEGASIQIEASKALVDLASKIGRAKRSKLPFKFGSTTESDVGGNLESSSNKRTVVHIRDLEAITSSRLGETIIQRLVQAVQKRRRIGEQIVIIATTAQNVEGPIESLLDASEDSPFRLTIIPPLHNMDTNERASFRASAPPIPTGVIFDDPSYPRIVEINMRHIRSMLRRLGQPDLKIRDCTDKLAALRLPGTHILSEKVLNQDMIQRLVLTAIGLTQTHLIADTLQPIHLGIATAILARADYSTHAYLSWQHRPVSATIKPSTRGASTSSADLKTPTEALNNAFRAAKLERLRKNANPHETRLLHGVVDPTTIKTGFADVHAPETTIEALKNMTTLSLLRPKEFEYGVLANDRLTGLLLYGPPGTGKTLLAKAVAKESNNTVLEVSGAQIYEKYVGEGEKMVRAVFSLAKKLSPCIVFIDEADAIFGSRDGGGGGNRNTHREIINQFLREWDGMSEHGVFMMVASNRPFDLDDAVLRRLPRRVLVDLPRKEDREAILKIHLKGEQLAEDVDLTALAEKTPLYSGSDLKNLCVAAALTAVKEGIEKAAVTKDIEQTSQSAESEPSKDAEPSSTAGDASSTSNLRPFSLPPKTPPTPERRVLTTSHFDKAIAEISASVSEDMRTLTAIRKFDEQYGDRKGRRKKNGLGFGMAAEADRKGKESDEGRVR
ncbi:hypothetical protein B0A48_02449 [Cryoendolithus antarcticus]|uniref:AAA+ ATPase domain-containing protein n=1 Tax=Cryoendolithus antarcticus TaxID=1507870 RepID=A0A1V8TNP2_9PEZI|nr:hypothetical protein B0A48_02449 [Cryoendolithus antarcticus]